METEFRKWGNSLALRVPSTFAKELGATEGQRARLTVEHGVLMVKVIMARPKPKYRLEKLLAGITEKNRHPEAPWGAPVGNELP